MLLQRNKLLRWAGEETPMAAKRRNHRKGNYADELLLPRKKRGFWRILWRLFLLLFLLGIIGGIAGFIIILNPAKLEPLSIEKLTDLKQTSLVYDIDGNLVGNRYQLENRVVKPLSEIPKTLQNAFIATEDTRFYQHHGVDFRRIAGSIWVDIKTGGYTQGASTIDQQLIKLTHLSSEKTLTRKLQEAWLAWQMENKYSKSEILEMYLNVVYFGKGAYGVQAAATVYFSKDVQELTLSECAVLAAIIKSPSNYAPHLHPDNTAKRKSLVLELMVKNQFITQEEADTAKQETITLVKDTTSSEYFVFIDQAIDQACALTNIPYDDFVTGGYRIYTTMDSGLQAACETLIKDTNLFPPNAEDDTEVEGAIVVLRPFDGTIAAQVGGRSYVARGLNRAQTSLRQPGSAIKPVLVYAQALEKGLCSPATPLLDQFTDFNGYSPSNAGNVYHGWVSARYALLESLNVPAVQFLQDVGLNAAMGYAEKVGIPFASEDRNLAIALGGFTTGITPLQLAASYQPFANGGIYTPPSSILSVETNTGKTIYQAKSRSTPVLSEESAYLLTSMLQSGVEEGTSHRLQDLGLPIAAKTGTVAYGKYGGVRDAWMVAYTPDYIVAVWNGFDKTNDTHIMPSNCSGGRYPALMTVEIFKHLYKQKQVTAFQRPAGVIDITLDKLAYENDHCLLLANDVTPEENRMREIFNKRFAPTAYSPYWMAPPALTDAWVTLDDASQPELHFTPNDDLAVYQVYRKTPRQYTPVMAAQFRGSDGPVTWADTQAAEAGDYAYTIVPIRLDATLDGSPLTGPTAGPFTVTVPSRFSPFPPFGKETPTPEPAASFELPFPLPTPTPESNGTMIE